MPEPAVHAQAEVRDYSVGDRETNSEFKPSKVGEPYNHPLPESNQDPWTILLEPLQAKDASRCKAWKEEVENLLIFAGLFSAVVTAFIVESYKTLQQDPADVAVVLLARMLDNAGGGGAMSNNSTIITNPAFSPTPANVRINILWFISLVLSLATVLFGIVSLQWLREHQRQRPELPPQLAYSLFHMHAEGIERWYLPQIFTMLPLLLQCGLVLFLIGTVEFLFQLNKSAAIPVIIVIGLVLFFLALTTVTPSLQATSLFLFSSSSTKAPRVQCPYMSPQSWAFHWFIAPIVQLVMRLCSLRLDSGRRFNADTVVAKNQILDQSWSHDLVDWLRFPPATRIIFRLAREDSWLDHGIAWLYQRDIDCVSASDDVGLRALTSVNFNVIPPPMFDAATALRKTVDSQSTKKADELLATENCIQHLSRAVRVASQRLNPPFIYFQYLLQINRHDVTKSDDIEALQDQYRFLSGHGYDSGQPLEIKQHRLEMALRLAEWGCTSPHQEHMGRDVAANMMTVIHHYVRDFPGSERHLSNILEKFFHRAAEFYPSKEMLEPPSSTTEAFLEGARDVLCVQSSSAITRDHQDSIFRFITVHLKTAVAIHAHSPQNAAPDFLFYTATIYVRQLLKEHNAEVSHELRTLTATLLEYNMRMERREDIEEYLEFSYDWRWKHPFSGFVSRAKRHGIVYPVTDEEYTEKVELLSSSKNVPNRLSIVTPVVEEKDTLKSGLLGEQARLVSSPDTAPRGGQQTLSSTGHDPQADDFDGVANQRPRHSRDIIPDIRPRNPFYNLSSSHDEKRTSSIYTT